MTTVPVLRRTAVQFGEANTTYYYEGTVLLDTRGIHNRGAGVESDGQGIAGQPDDPSSVEAYASREL